MLFCLTHVCIYYIHMYMYLFVYVYIYVDFCLCVLINRNIQPIWSHCMQSIRPILSGCSFVVVETIMDGSTPKGGLFFLFALLL